MSNKRIALVFSVLVVASMVLTACGGAQTAVQTVIVQGTPQVVEVTTTPAPTEPSCDNPALGSCKLDGNGIPPDFFSDIHVRKAFNYCFDWDSYIKDALQGEAVQNVGPLVPDMLGYDQNGPHYTYDLDKCKSEFQQAWDGKVWENGFRMQIAYNTGNITRQTIAQILQNNINSINDKFQIEIVGMPWPSFLNAIRASRLPLYISGWIEDIHDPHNWAQPFMVGTYASRQRLPADMVAGFQKLVNEGVSTTDPAKRAEIYKQLTQADYDNAIAIRLAVATNRIYLQKWISGYYYNPINELPGRWYTLSKDAGAKNPDTFTYATFGDPGSLDPAWDYENVGINIENNVYDRLVTYDKGDATSFVPSLATSWDVSDDGMTYTFHIRDGVKFHQGQDLTPDDVAYTFQRAILQGGTFSPMWLFTEPFFGVGVSDVAEVVDPSGALDDSREDLQAADPQKLMDVCTQLQNAIVADDSAGTVTMTLKQPWGPFLATLAQGWSSIINKEWAVQQGAWDGDCSTWQNFYSVTDETAPLTKVENGTGPYVLDHWTPTQEIVLTANNDYWRTAEVGPAYDGGPVGPPAIQRVVQQNVTEWGTRFAMYQAGDADLADVDRQYEDQMAPLVANDCAWNADTSTFDCSAGPGTQLTVYHGAPTVTRTDAMFVFDVAH